MNDLADRLERLKADLATLDGANKHVAHAAKAVRADARRGYPSTAGGAARKNHRVYTNAAAAAAGRRRQQVARAEPDTDQFKVAAARRAEQQRRVEKQRQQRRHANGVYPNNQYNQKPMFVDEDNTNAAALRAAEPAELTAEQLAQQAQQRARKEAREQARQEMLRDRQQYKAKIALDKQQRQRSSSALVGERTAQHARAGLRVPRPVSAANSARSWREGTGGGQASTGRDMSERERVPAAGLSRAASALHSLARSISPRPSSASCVSCTSGTTHAQHRQRLLQNAARSSC